MRTIVYDSENGWWFGVTEDMDRASDFWRLPYLHRALMEKYSFRLDKAIVLIPAEIVEK
jgi:hypothetical protein